jgi:hypothetical protein
MAFSLEKSHLLACLVDQNIVPFLPKVNLQSKKGSVSSPGPRLFTCLALPIGIWGILDVFHEKRHWKSKEGSFFIGKTAERK